LERLRSVRKVRGFQAAGKVFKLELKSVREHEHYKKKKGDRKGEKNRRVLQGGAPFQSQRQTHPKETIQKRRKQPENISSEKEKKKTKNVLTLGVTQTCHQSKWSRRPSEGGGTCGERENQTESGGDGRE